MQGELAEAVRPTPPLPKPLRAGPRLSPPSHPSPACAASAPLRTLRLALPPCLPPCPALPAYLPQLQAAAVAAPVAVREQVLLALHPQAGRCSLLQLLPLQVVREVIDLAAPLASCAIQLAPLPVPAGG